MGYSIAELEKYTGIKAHTIRIWEQRYELLKPHRTDTNIRFYDDDQLKKLLNVASLVRGGLRISKICKMDSDQMNMAVETISQDKHSATAYAKEINELISSALTFQEEPFHRTFANCLIKYGLEETYFYVLLPVLTRTGVMWTTGDMNVCQEHFISNLVRQKLFTAADKLAHPREGSQTWLLFLPDQEDHDIGLLYANFLIRQSGHKVIYLGQRVPMSELEDNLRHLKPDRMLTFIRHTQSPEEAQQFLDNLGETFGEFNPVCSGSRAFLESLEQPDGVELLTDPIAFMEMLKA